MTIKRKGSRKITVDEIVFWWKATGNDGWISIVICPERMNVKIVGTFEYHSVFVKESINNQKYSKVHGQIIITNRVIKSIIHSVGIDKIMISKGTIHLGRLENIYDIDQALREPTI